MRQVVIALIPALIASVIFFRQRAVIVILAALAGAFAGEIMAAKMRKRPVPLNDWSAAVTGILLALILPPATPFWAAFLGSFFGIVVAKHVFGGLGQNIFNPALAGRAFMMAAFPVMMTTWSQPFTLDAVTGATPLAAWKFGGELPSMYALFMGSIPGCLGETSALALILGGAYLFLKKVADWRAPAGMLIGTVILAGIFQIVDPANGSVMFHLLAGGFMLGMFFMVTDPVTTPMPKKGRFIFGLMVGILLMVIRKWAGLPEGVMYSILFMNAFVPIIDRLTRPKAFGRV